MDSTAFITSRLHPQEATGNKRIWFVDLILKSLAHNTVSYLYLNSLLFAGVGRLSIAATADAAAEEEDDEEATELSSILGRVACLPPRFDLLYIRTHHSVRDQLRAGGDKVNKKTVTRKRKKKTFPPHCRRW